MAIALRKETNFRLKHALSSGDYIKDEIQAKFNNDTRTSMESKIAGEGDEINIETGTDIDIESAYEDSFCSDTSENESELTNNTHHSPVNEITAFQFTNFKSVTKIEDSLNLCKKYASTSKICDGASVTLEDRVKCLSLNEVRPTSTINVRSTRKNMSFTNDEIMKIERDNELLLRKIMAQQRPQKVKILSPQPKLSSSAINRKKLQRKIEEDNMILLRRLQQAKSCVHNTNKIPGYRATHL